jgi:hypothetical protein
VLGSLALVLACALAAAVIAVLASCGTPTPSAPPYRTTVPTPDLCTVISRPIVTTAMHGKPAHCRTSGGANGFTTSFTGTARLPGGKAPATLAVTYEPRHDPRTGADRWQTLGSATGSRVRLIGVGEQAVFDPKRAPQLRTTEHDLIVSVGLSISGALVPQAKLPDDLLAVARAAVAAAG